MLIVGLLVAVVGGYLVWDFRQFRTMAITISGIVTGYKARRSHSRNSRSQETYAPIIQYRYGGEDHEFTARVSSSSTKYAIGEEVPVLISPEDPSDARLDSNMTTILGTLFFVIGMGCSIGFFFVFEATLFSFVAVGVVTLMIMIQIALRLRQHKIGSLQDLKKAAQQAQQDSGRLHSTHHSQPTGRNIISDNKTLARRKAGKPVPAWVGVIVLLLGIGVSMGGGDMAQKRAAFLQSAQTTHGKVVSFERTTSTSDGRTTTTYYPKVNYTPSDIQGSITFKHDIGSSHPSYQIGDRVTVLYSPDDHHEAIIDSGWMNWFAPLLLGTVGIAFTLAGAALLRSRLRKQPEEEALELEI